MSINSLFHRCSDSPLYKERSFVDLENIDDNFPLSARNQIIVPGLKSYCLTPRSRLSLPITEDSLENPLYKMPTFVRFGNYYTWRGGSWRKKVPLLWSIIDEELVSSNKHKVLLLCNTSVFRMKPTSGSWSSCSIKAWLNETFYNETFSDVEKSFIDDPFIDIGGDPGCKIFCLSNEEFEFFQGFDLPTLNYGVPLDVTNTTLNSWWLRDGSSPSSNSYYVIGTDAQTGECTKTNITNLETYYHVRPAMWVSLTPIEDNDTTSYNFIQRPINPTYCQSIEPLQFKPNKVLSEMPSNYSCPESFNVVEQYSLHNPFASYKGYWEEHKVLRDSVALFTIADNKYNYYFYFRSTRNIRNTYTEVSIQSGWYLTNSQLIYVSPEKKVYFSGRLDSIITQNTLIVQNTLFHSQFVGGQTFDKVVFPRMSIYIDCLYDFSPVDLTKILPVYFYPKNTKENGDTVSWGILYWLGKRLPSDHSDYPNDLTVKLKKFAITKIPSQYI